MFNTTSLYNTEIISESDNSSGLNSENSDNIDITENYDNIMYSKYLKNNYLSKTELLQINNNTKIEESVNQNNYKNVIKLLEDGNTLYNSNKNTIIKLCSKNCNINKKCDKQCYKNGLLLSILNTNRGIKTCYHLLLKIIIINPKFRNLCKCCENIEYRDYLLKLDKNFMDKRNLSNINENIQTKLDPKILLELQINYLINKFMNIIGLLPCECKFKNKYSNFYKDNYLNFKDTMKIYTRTIPNVIKMLKILYDIKDNHEELQLIKNSRCIHEDIRFNNLTYCKEKKYETFSNKIVNELIMNLEIINDWIINSIRISIHLFNQQSLEYFRYILNKNIDDDISTNFEKIYNKTNELLDLNYLSNKKNIINSLIEYYNNISENDLLKLIKTIINQLEYRNSIANDSYDINDILINYIIESFQNSNIVLGLEFFKYINNLELKKEYRMKLQFIFDSLLINDTITIKNKITCLKTINKNKINIIGYDLLNKLIDLEQGDKIILEFNKDENSLFNIDDYKNSDYIKDIITKCIIQNKVNILDYVLYNLDTSIKFLKINPIIIYLNNIDNYTHKDEYKYISLLKMILKYKYEYTKEEISNKITDIIYYCIEKKLTNSCKLFIENDYDVTSKINKKNLLHYCIDNQNHIIAEYIIKKNPIIITKSYNNLNVINYLFEVYTKQNFDINILMRFIIKIITPIKNRIITHDIINYQDDNNELFGYKILNSNLSSENKIILFNMIKDIINPIEIDKKLNFPLILFSVLLDEYEITYIMLNNLLKNNIIKKEINQINTLFNYYHTESTININFIPIIFKFLKDNHDKYNNFDDNKYNKLIIYPIDEIIIKYILIILQSTVYLISENINNTYSKYVIDKAINYKYKQNNKSNKQENDFDNFDNFNKYVNDINISESNKYMEITLDNDISDISNMNNNIFKKYISDEESIKENIYQENVNKVYNYKDNIKTISIINSDDTSISESEICFIDDN